MPFLRGDMPLRRTLYYLKQGRWQLRNEVKVVMFGYHWKPLPRQKGAHDFLFWHLAQLQYHNPKIQFAKQQDLSVTPFALAFLGDGREVLFDLEFKKREEIVDILLKTLGKTELVLNREKSEKLQEKNPADFGVDCARQCLCEVQGQVACTSLLLAPDYMKGRWRWNHNVLSC